MRYLLQDDAVDPAQLLAEPQREDAVAGVVGAEAGGAAAVLGDFVAGLDQRRLMRLAELTAQGAGYGHEFAGSMFDDDLDEDDEPFEGVLISAQFRDDDVVMSRDAYNKLVGALLARLEARSPQ
jgi:hypothetical protein